MLALGIHSSTGELGLGLWQGSAILSQKTWLLKRELLNQLPLCLQTFITPDTWPRCQYLAVAKGPGSFTSIRIGMVAARTLAQQLDIPLFAISSLQGVAQSFLASTHSPFSGKIAVTCKATRGYLYGAIYESVADKLIPLSTDQLWLPEAWQAHLEQHKIQQLIAAPDDLGHTVGEILTLAYAQWQAGDRPHWSTAEPFYGMSPTDP